MANVALPESDSKPVAAVKLPVMPFWFVNASTSSLLSRLLVIWTVALSMFVSSTSVTATVLANTLAASPIAKLSDVLLLERTGASLTRVTSIVRVCVFESLSPSLTLNVTVR